MRDDANAIHEGDPRDRCSARSSGPTDPGFKQAVDQGKLSETGFRNYYGLRASVGFSYGSHDEWNLARTINERRRGATDYGIAKQLPIFFDGRPVTPGGYETPAAAGDAGRCVN